MLVRVTSPRRALSWSNRSLALADLLDNALDVQVKLNAEINIARLRQNKNETSASEQRLPFRENGCY